MPAPTAVRIAVVDPDNRFVRWTDRATIHREQLVHRSAHVAILDPAGRLLLQRRHRDKLTFPGHWDVSTAGHVEEPDYAGADPDADLAAVYARVARREVAEELGVDVTPTFVAAFPPLSGVHYEWIHLFRAVSAGPFRLQAEEVEEVRWVAPGDLAAFLAREPVTRTLGLFHAAGVLAGSAGQ
jgi:isopentenyldiphosphate isomerase